MACWLVGLWFSAGGVVGAADECDAYYCTANCDQWSTKCTCEARFCDTYFGDLLDVGTIEYYRARWRVDSGDLYDQG